MKVERQLSLESIMSQKIKPLEVSPLIRTARYILLFSGIVYGIMKLGALRTYELTAGPKRQKMYEEQHIIEHERILREMRRELVDVADQMQLPDIPPGWEQDVE